MRGKNAARAAPMLALAPLSRFSAWRMSGRLQQHVGRQAGGDVLQRGERFGKPCGQQVAGPGRRPPGSGRFRPGPPGWCSGRCPPAPHRRWSGPGSGRGRRRPRHRSGSWLARRRLLARQGVLGELQALPVGGQGQIAGGDLGDQADLHAAPGLLGGEELLQGLVLEAPHPAEQVELLGADAEADVVLLDGHRVPEPERVRRDPLTAAGGRGIDLGEELGAPDLVLGPGPLDVRGRPPAGRGCSPGPARSACATAVDEELLPGDVGDRLSRLGRSFL